MLTVGGGFCTGQERSVRFPLFLVLGGKCEGTFRVRTQMVKVRVRSMCPLRSMGI
jgi:hypothetical protein